MRIRAKALIGISSLLLAACSNAKEDEAERLGFSSALEMEQIHSKGWHTNAQYVADETERSKRLGFANMDELHDAESEGILDPVRYRNHKAAEEARAEKEAREAEVGDANAPEPEAPVVAGESKDQLAGNDNPKQVKASQSVCMKLSGSTQRFVDEIGTSIGVNPNNIEVVGGEYPGAGDICLVTISTPLGTMKCNGGAVMTDDGGRSYYVGGRPLGVNNSCSKVR